MEGLARRVCIKMSTKAIKWRRSGEAFSTCDISQHLADGVTNWGLGCEEFTVTGWGREIKNAHCRVQLHLFPPLLLSARSCWHSFPPLPAHVLHNASCQTWAHAWFPWGFDDAGNIIHRENYPPCRHAKQNSERGIWTSYKNNENSNHGVFTGLLLSCQWKAMHFFVQQTFSLVPVVLFASAYLHGS